MNEISPTFLYFFRIAGNAVYILGALLESDNGREKVIQLLKEKNPEEDNDLIFNLARLTDLNEYSTTMNGEIEAQTNASGTTALIVSLFYRRLNMTFHRKRNAVQNV